MSSFRTSALSLLNRLYRFSTARIAPEAVELMVPIQLVHDVSRELELVNSEFAHHGLVSTTISTTHAAGEAKETEWDPFSPTESLWGGGEVPSDLWMWPLALGIVSSEGDFSSAQVSVALPAVGVAMEAMDVLIMATDTARQINAVDATLIDATFETGEPAIQTPLRVPIIQGPGGTRGTLRVRHVSGAAGTIQTNVILWLGRVGTFPPGSH